MRAPKQLLVGVVAALVLVPAVGVAAQDSTRDFGIAEESVLRTLNSLIQGSESAFGPVESPFDEGFAGTTPPFIVVGESRLAVSAPLGDERPFENDLFTDAVTTYLPDTNDYFVNSPYLVVNTVEVSEPVSHCGPNEYREVAVFITRAGMPTIDENPLVPNDPGVGASEAVSLICNAGLTDPFFGLSENGALRQYALPYDVFEFAHDDRFFVSFITLDPFASAQVVGSFAVDSTVQTDFGFVRGEATEIPPLVDPATAPILEPDAMAWANTSDLVVHESPEATPVDSPDDPTVAETDTEVVDDPVVEEQTPQVVEQEDQASAGAEIETDVAEPETSSSMLPRFLGGLVGAGIIFGGVVLYRRRVVTLRSDSKPLLSHAEEVRVRGERAGLAKHGDWQQIPYELGREFRVRGSVTTRTYIDDDDYRSDVSFDGRPWQWSDASRRDLNLPTYFGFWINSEGTLRVGSPTDPYQYDSLRDESEYPVDQSPEDDAAPSKPLDKPMNLDGAYEGKDAKGIPPA